VIVHAGLIALRQGGVWRGVLVAGPSGAGKSDLMLRAMDSGFGLVADDRTVVWASGGRLFGRAPDVLHGRMEVRGLGVLRRPALRLAQAALMARCEAADAILERLPDEAFETVAGVRLPLVRIHALEGSAPAKIACALKRLGQAS
jgi:serine kinase of HPr protein (carbohydrate metabolism regulator)